MNKGYKLVSVRYFFDACVAGRNWMLTGLAAINVKYLDSGLRTMFDWIICYFDSRTQIIAL